MSRTDGKHGLHTSRQDSENGKIRDNQLRAELANVRKVNEAIEGVIASLEKAKTNMATVDRTVSASTSLLKLWTGILSQTEHNQRLILDPTWQGASQDIVDTEAEEQERELAAERRVAEEQERKATAARKAEEDERRKSEAVSKASKTSSAVRGRVRGLARGAGLVPQTPSSSSNTSILGNARGTSGSRRTTSGISRGTRGTRSKT